VSAVIAAEIADEGFQYLKAPIKQVTALDTTVPYSEPMEAYVLPNEEKIAGAARQVVGSAPVAA
jgi:acetoin:2,6-dichlorophenolindophenol oxidoreductase subunit beta